MQITGLALLSVAMALLGSCEGQVITLKNDQGEIARCEVSQSTALWFGTLARDIQMSDCVTRHEKAGYRKTGA